MPSARVSAIRTTLLPWLLALLAALVSVEGCGGQSPAAKRQAALERADASIKQGKLNEAIIEYQNALKGDDSFVPALHGLGRAYMHKYWIFDAARELGRAHKLAEDAQDISIDYGRALVEIGAWDEAEAQAARILARSPDHLQARYIRAGALLGRAKSEEALAILNALPESGGLPELGAARAEALLSTGKIEQAETAFRAAVLKEPNDARSFAGLGLVALIRERWGDAARYYDQAKSMREADPRIRLGLAAAYARLGKVEEAIAELAGVDPRARNPGVVAALGVYYLQANRPAEAAQLLAPVVTRTPRFVYGRFLLGTAYLQSGRAGEALDQFEELERQLPTDPAVQLRTAMAEALVGRPRAALTRLDLLARTLDTTPEYHVERARSLFMLGRLDEAQRAATRARELAPTNPVGYLLLGEIAQHRGDAATARAMFARSAQVNTGYVPGHLALGSALLREGAVDAALRAFDDAVRADPRSLAAAATKASALVSRGRARDAIAFVESALADDPRRPGFNALLGQLLFREQQLGPAASAFRRELDWDQKSVDARLGLAQVALRQGNEAEAVGQLQTLAESHPGHAVGVHLLNSLLQKQGRADLAVPILERALAARPKDSGFAVLLGELYLKTARYADAIRVLTEALAVHADLPAARLIRARALLGKGESLAAIKELTEITRAYPQLDLGPYFLAQAYSAIGRADDAKRAYREALRINPQFELARLELAVLAGDRLEDPGLRDALQGLRAAVKKDPRNVFLRESLVRALLMHGQVTAVQAELKEILEIAPLHLGANFMTARLLMQQGREEQAAGYLETVLRSNPGHVGSNALLAQHYEQHGQISLAIRHLEAALAVDSSLGDAQLRLGALYIQSKRYDDALGLAASMERSAPNTAEPLVLRGAVLLAQAKGQQALEVFQAAARLRPNMLEAQRGLGDAYQVLGQPERSIEAYRRALALNGNDVVSLNNLAWALAETHPDQALPLALKASQLDPRSMGVADTLAWVHYQRGAYADAHKILSPLVERAPNDAGIQYHLGMTYYRMGRKTDAMYALRRAAQLDRKIAGNREVAALLKELGG